MKYIITFGMMLVLVFGISDTYAQKSTEIFIPIGKSPGVSGIYSVIAKIENVKSEDRTINLSQSSEDSKIVIPENTPIWLDRSKLKMTNQVGDFSNLKTGLTIEVKYKDKEHKGEVEWVKIQVEKTGG